MPKSMPQASAVPFARCCTRYTSVAAKYTLKSVLTRASAMPRTLLWSSATTTRTPAITGSVARKRLPRRRGRPLRAMKNASGINNSSVMAHDTESGMVVVPWDTLCTCVMRPNSAEKSAAPTSPTATGSLEFSSVGQAVPAPLLCSSALALLLPAVADRATSIMSDTSTRPKPRGIHASGGRVARMRVSAARLAANAANSARQEALTSPMLQNRQTQVTKHMPNPSPLRAVPR